MINGSTNILSVATSSTFSGCWGGLQGQ
jgi:hypothetical protein